MRNLAISRLAELAGDPDRLYRVKQYGQRCRWCTTPVRLGASELSSVAGRKHERVVFKACGSRQATRCPSCSRLYRGDARHIIRAGLRGGKDVSESVSDHRAVFVTLTAPSFGLVHRESADGQCRKGRNALCVHGRPMICNGRHHSKDGLARRPLCGDCYDYERAILWNALAPELWRRTTIAIRRELAKVLGVERTRGQQALPVVICEGCRIPEARCSAYSCDHPCRCFWR